MKELKQKQDSSGKYGFVDPDGRWVILPLFEEVEPQLIAVDSPLSFTFYDFLDGNAIVKYKGKWGLICSSGDWLAKPVYDSIDQFYDGFAKVYKNGTGFIDKNGHEVIKPTRDLSWNYPHYKVVYEPIYKKYGVIYSDGEWAKKPAIPRGISPIKKIWVKYDDKYGYISLEYDGGWIAEPHFLKIYYHFDGLARVQYENGKWGWINEDGEWVIDPIFDEAEPFTTDGTARVKIAGKPRIIDHQGEFVEDFEEDLL